jgi:hypothetical protein
MPATEKATKCDKESVAFIHILLKEDFNHNFNVPDVGIGKKSLFVAFRDPRLAEEALELLQLEAHEVNSTYEL